MPSRSRLPHALALCAALIACGRSPGTSQPTSVSAEATARGEASCRDAGAGPEPDAARLRSFVHGRARELRGCYERALKRDASAGGKATLRFTIGSCGGLSDVVVTGRRGRIDEAAACAAQAMRSWRTPFRPSQPVTVEYPVSFTAAM